MTCTLDTLVSAEDFFLANKAFRFRKIDDSLAQKSLFKYRVKSKYHPNPKEKGGDQHRKYPERIAQAAMPIRQDPHPKGVQN